MLRVFVVVVAMAVVAALGAPLTVETLHALRRVSAHAVNAHGALVWSQREWRPVRPALAPPPDAPSRARQRRVWSRRASGRQRRNKRRAS